MTSANSTQAPFRAVIAGAGVAGLEAALALRELAGDRVRTTMLAPATEFVYRPMRVREPFAYGAARTYALDDIARDIGAALQTDSFRWLDPARRVVHTGAGGELEYDALLLALGARLRPAFRHVVTIDDRVLDEQLHGLIQDVEGGYVRRIAFLAPSPMPWPLPLYELALMTARRAYESNVDLAITVATPEEAPLAVFGGAVSDAVTKLLADSGIATVTSAYCEVAEPGRVAISPGLRHLEVDRIVALPRLLGPSALGPGGGAGNGFIEVDRFCRVPRFERVYAAGDATDFPVKHGGIAAQQADTAAQGIAALAGAPVSPEPFEPVIEAVLLGGAKPLYLSAHLTGGHGTDSQVSTPPGATASKIAAKYLAPYLKSRDQAAVR